MIKLGKMRWSNAFSYGENNEIDFSKDQLTQLVGKNGHGKTSIALILEEVLFNKNTKGVKKGRILNRNNGAKSYSIDLEFSVYEDEYVVSTKRGSTQTVKLEKNGVDISSHTSTSTYKQIEQILGMDHKTFTQIVSQSNASSLEFLTSTDSTRKKFLIDLFNLVKYTEEGDKYKELLKSQDASIQVLQGKLNTVNLWISKNDKVDLTELPIIAVPNAPTELLEKKAELANSLATLAQQNKAILQNNKYKEILDSLKVVVLEARPVDRSSEFMQIKAEALSAITDSDKVVAKFGKLKGCCPTCDSPINESMVATVISAATDSRILAEVKRDKADLAIKAEKAIQTAWQEQNAINERFEQYHQLYNPNLSKELLVESEIKAEITKLNTLIDSANAAISAATAENNKATAHNAKVKVISEQINTLKIEKLELEIELKALQERKALLEVLVKTFSTSGLVAYKIECLVEDLEQVTNEYLADLSGGRFQLGFQIAGSDKLNVVMTDNGKDVEIVELSNGERARVNAAALLAIRRLIQSTTSTQINLLFLDETIENLDLDGKEKLVEVLLAEEKLNTFLVSHGFQHPLLEKVQVVQENSISRIE